MPAPTNLRPASFRGVPFQVTSADTDGLGQRTQVHQYPERDLPYVEELGLDAATYSFDAYTIGDSYATDRDSLIAACQQRGIGQLVHPTLGERKVKCVACSLRENVSELGLARFALSFVDAGENSFPTSSPFTSGLIGARVASASSAVQATFAKAFSVAGVPQWVVTDGTRLLATVQSALALAVRSVPKVDGANLGQVARDLARLTTGAATLLGDPGGLASQIAGIATAVGTMAAGPLDALRAFETLAAFTADVDYGSTITPARTRASGNQAAMEALMRRAAVVEAARGTPDVQLASYSEADALRTRLSGLLDDQITAAADALQDDDAQALADLRAEVVRDLTLRAGQLRVVQTFTPIGTVPAVLIAQRLYGDGLRADEIVARNSVIEHPGFVPGGVELEVLSA